MFRPFGQHPATAHLEPLGKIHAHPLDANANGLLQIVEIFQRSFVLVAGVGEHGKGGFGELLERQ